MTKKQPVMSVDRVEACWEGRVLRVLAEGSTSTLGWTDAVLLAGARSGGGLELSLVATPPPGMAAQAIGEVEASIQVDDAEALHRVSVRSAGNLREVAVPRR